MLVHISKNIVHRYAVEFEISTSLKGVDRMKVKYMVKHNHGEYEPNNNFTFGTEYKVLADYRERQSGQEIADNGFVVINNRGEHSMLFSNEIKIIEDGKPCYTFSYS